MNINIRSLSLILGLWLYGHDTIAQRIEYYSPEFRLATPWTSDVNPDNPWPEYPRPSMVRPEWKSLNGRWHFTKTGKEDPRPTSYEREIIVPYPVESALSGIGAEVTPDDKVWYKRTFFVPEVWSGRIILLHIGASDWETTVYINGTEIGKHRGGYSPFSFDISPYLDERGVQEITIAVWDPTNKYHQPRGKQRIEPKGIWYTPVSGIWQSVWIEPVGLSSISAFRSTPDIDNSMLHLSATAYNGLPGDSIRAIVSYGGSTVAEQTFSLEEVCAMQIPSMRLWSTEKPTLYDLRLSLLRKGRALDAITSRIAMRKVNIAEDKNGIKRLFLNNQPIFQYGLLDQGWWPDGLYTAPTDEALRSDIERTKDMGFNLIRKHVKVEPDRWYAHCDEMGVLVWQDMPNSDKNAEWKPPSGIDGIEIERKFVSEAQFKIEFEEMINHLYNHPSIIKWIPFNEGWGQFKTEHIFDWVLQIDSTRMLGGPSGGNYFPVGDTRDHHRYPGPEMPPEDPDRALILGEFGGLGLPLKGHLWQADKNWGYQTLQNEKDLEKRYLEMIEQLKPMLPQGLAGAIYTQTTDVEGEVNGTMTYDRRVIKFKGKKIRKAHQELFQAFDEAVK